MTEHSTSLSPTLQKCFRDGVRELESRLVIQLESAFVREDAKLAALDAKLAAVSASVGQLEEGSR
jgi:hypothetical protein